VGSNHIVPSRALKTIKQLIQLALPPKMPLTDKTNRLHDRASTSFVLVDLVLTETTDKKTKRNTAQKVPVLPVPNMDFDSDEGRDTEPCGDGDQELTLAEVLGTLHLLNPLLDVLQYTRLLTNRGILYANGIKEHKHQYYVDTIGMPDALVHQMFDQAEKMERSVVSKAGGTGRLR
jgi:hypothetical protein